MFHPLLQAPEQHFPKNYSLQPPVGVHWLHYTYSQVIGCNQAGATKLEHLHTAGNLRQHTVTLTSHRPRDIKPTLHSLHALFMVPDESLAARAMPALLHLVPIMWRTCEACFRPHGSCFSGYGCSWSLARRDQDHAEFACHTNYSR